MAPHRGMGGCLLGCTGAPFILVGLRNPHLFSFLGKPPSPGEDGSGIEHAGFPIQLHLLTALFLCVFLPGSLLPLWISVPL
ncbi:unnamed protein product [Urochloa humidicola]